MKISFNFGLFSLLIFLISAGAIFGFSPQSAYADPHAVFYTVSGQQQLFFNMLAALDQADYVEPAKQTVGLPEGQSRQEILDKRAKADFGEETDPALKATKTELASVLTRSITLEGNDMWSSYLVLQFALESARRQNSAKLIEIFCQRGLGIKECKENSEPSKIAEARVDHTYDNQPQKIWDRMLGAVKGALLSGLGFDQQKRRDKLSPDNLDADKELPYDDALASLQDQVSGNPKKQSTVQRWIANTINVPASAVDSDVLSDITFDENGQAQLAFNSASDGSSAASLSTEAASLGNLSGSRVANVDDYYRKLTAVVAAPAQVFASATAAQQQQALLDAVKTKAGIKGDTVVVPKAAAGNRIGALKEQLVAPPVAKVDQIGTAIQNVSDVSSTAYSADSQANVPGKTQTLEHVDNEEGKVEGISSDQATNSQGKVLGDQDGVSTKVDTDIPNQPRRGANSDPIFFGGEPPVLAFIRALGPENSGGCGCSADDVANTYGNDFFTN